MILKYKVIKDFQFTNDDKKIISIKKNTIIENYMYIEKNVELYIDSEIIENNLEYFEEIDWKKDLLMFMKLNKISQPSIIHKKILPFVESLIKNDISNIDDNLYLDKLEEKISIIEEKNTIINNINLNNKNKDEYIKKCEDNILIFKDDIKSLKLIIENKESEINRLSTEILNKNTEISNIVNNISDSKVKEDILLKNDTIIELHKKVDILNNKVLERDTELISLNGIKNILEKEITSKNELISELEKNISELEISYNEYKNNFNDILDSKIKEYESRLPYQYRKENWHLLR